MRRTVPLILTLFICMLCQAQHISEFESLAPGAQNSDFHLPENYTFQYLIEKGDLLDSGESLPGSLDFAGYVPRQGSSKYGYLSINSEARPGAVTILDIEFDDLNMMWMVDHSEAVNFSFNLPAEIFAALAGEDVGSTIANCSGAVTPWNTIITCEEYTTQNVLNIYPDFPEVWFKVDGDSNGYDGYGWAVEIDPVTKSVIDQDGGRSGQDKLWALGNFKHENAVIHNNKRTVYQGADDTTGEGYLYKFVADEAEDLSSGSLFVYKMITPTTGEWILLNNSSIAEQNSTLEQSTIAGATSFGGIEDVDISPVDGLIYFAVKRDGKVYRFEDSDPVSGTSVTNFETYVGGMSYEVKPGVSEPWGTGNDNLLFDSLGNLWVAQDGSNNYIWVVDQGHKQADPKVRIFARTPNGSEPTGLTFSPDEKYIFMSIQHPSGNNNSSSQQDAFGNNRFFDKDVTLVLARNANLNRADNVSEPTVEIMITQYYHDDTSDSKWIEVKNISGIKIPAGSYFLDLFDSGSLDNMSDATPKASEPVPEMEAGEVLLFKNRTTPEFPQNNHLGNAEQIQSDVCNFDGDDMVLITTTPGTRKYNNRKDILGSVPAINWGANKVLVRGGNSNELPERDFIQGNWLEMDSLDEVNNAVQQQNLALGTHQTGPTRWNGASWTALDPDRTRIAIIENDFSGGSTDLRAYDLTVNDGATLQFEDNVEGQNHNVVIYHDLEVQSGGNFVIGDTESLILKDENPEVQGNIQKIENSVYRNHKNDITYWSSPVSNELVENVFTTVDPSRIFYYDQSGFDINEPYFDVWINQPSGPMQVGKGYASEGPQGETGVHQLNFYGVPNAGDIEVTDLIFDNDQGNNEDLNNDFNLIGNPYPSAIDMESFLETNVMENEVIDGTVYFWTHATPLSGGQYAPSDYATYNFMGGVSSVENLEVRKNIGSGQGFFVRTTDAGNILFSPDMILEGSNDQFFKQVKNSKEVLKRDRAWISLRASDGSYKQILIGFDERATEGIDSGFDAIYLKGNQPVDFYSLVDDNMLSIQGLGESGKESRLRLGFDTAVEGLELKIEISRLEGSLKDREVLLLDHDLGTIHDLKNSPYAFTNMGKGAFKDRFELIFNRTLLAVDALENKVVKVFTRDSHLFVESPVSIEQVSIYDILGRKIMFVEPRSYNFDIGLNRINIGEIMVVELIDENGRRTLKKTIRH